MIKHVLMANLLPDVTHEDVDNLIARWRALPDEIPDVVTLHAGRNLGLRDRQFEISAVAEFSDVDGWKRFIEHPRHMAFRDEVSINVVDPATVVTVQFEM